VTVTGIHIVGNADLTFEQIKFSWSYPYDFALNVKLEKLHNRWLGRLVEKLFAAGILADAN